MTLEEMNAWPVGSLAFLQMRRQERNEAFIRSGKSPELLPRWDCSGMEKGGRRGAQGPAHPWGLQPSMGAHMVELAHLVLPPPTASAFPGQKHP